MFLLLGKYFLKKFEKRGPNKKGQVRENLEN